MVSSHEVASRVGLFLNERGISRTCPTTVCRPSLLITDDKDGSVGEVRGFGAFVVTIDSGVSVITLISLFILRIILTVVAVDLHISVVRSRF